MYCYDGYLNCEYHRNNDPKKVCNYNGRCEEIDKNPEKHLCFLTCLYIYIKKEK